MLEAYLVLHRLFAFGAQSAHPEARRAAGSTAQAAGLKVVGCLAADLTPCLFSLPARFSPGLHSFALDPLQRLETIEVLETARLPRRETVIMVCQTAFPVALRRSFTELVVSSSFSNRGYQGILGQ